MKTLKFISITLFFILFITGCPRNGENGYTDTNGNGEEIIDDFFLENITKNEAEKIITDISNAVNGEILSSTTAQDTLLIYAIELEHTPTNINLIKIKIVEVIYNTLNINIGDGWIINENENHVVEFTHRDVLFRIILEPNRNIFYVLLSDK